MSSSYPLPSPSRGREKKTSLPFSILPFSPYKSLDCDFPAGFPEYNLLHVVLTDLNGTLPYPMYSMDPPPTHLSDSGASLHYSFSLLKPLLYLPPSPVTNRPSPPSLYLLIPPSSLCHSADPLFHKLLGNFIGYDVVILNMFLSSSSRLATNWSKAYLKLPEDLSHSSVTDISSHLAMTSPPKTSTALLTRLNFLLFKSGVILTTLFLFFTTTTLVSFTLRSTQSRMLTFTYSLRRRVREGRSVGDIVVKHVLASLIFVPVMVGILFFLFEFFNDQFLAIAVLSIVWFCEVYTVICVRTWENVTFFPQVFFLYFTLFHIYFLSSPHGFCYLALLTTVFFLAHSMVFFWSRFEVKAIATGLITRDRARMTGTRVVGNWDLAGDLLEERSRSYSSFRSSPFDQVSYPTIPMNPSSRNESAQWETSSVGLDISRPPSPQGSGGSTTTPLLGSFPFFHPIE